MKLQYHKIVKQITICFCSLLLLVNCSENNNNDKEVSSDTFITAKVDGVEFSINDFVAAVSQEYEGVEYYTILISSGSVDESGFGFGLLLFPKSEGTFDINERISLSFSQVDNSNDSIKVWAAGGFINNLGTITITKINDSYIEGTFSFTGERNTLDGIDTIEVTEGKFKALR